MSKKNREIKAVVNGQPIEEKIEVDENFTLKSYNGVPYSPENKDQFNALTKYNNEVKKQALLYVMAEVEKIIGSFANPERIKSAFKAIYRPRGTGEKVAKKSDTSAKVSALFTNIGDEVDEGSLFMQLKLGRAEMRMVRTSLIKHAKNPDERKWITFNQESGIYKLVAIGSTAPTDWTGYKPESTTETVLTD